jgi:hypothetical protein
MRVEKQDFVMMRVLTLMVWSNENKSCMRVEKREFAREFSQLSCRGQTRTRVAWELRSESLHESFLNSHGLVKQEQELHESWWELRSESLHESFLNYHAPVKQEQELHESWWELRSESLHESFLNYHAPVKQEQELHESWWELRSESLHESFLNSRVPVKWEQKLHESWLDVTLTGRFGKIVFKQQKLSEVGAFVGYVLDGRQLPDRRSWLSSNCVPIEMERVPTDDFIWIFTRNCVAISVSTVAWDHS